MKRFVGSAIPRKEDARFLTGHGVFGDDLACPGALHALLLRSPHAHAGLLGIDAAAARAMPGVRGVYTHTDLAADGVRHIPSLTRDPDFALSGAFPSPMPDPPRHVLVSDKARHVGDPVAMVVADSVSQAEDAIAAIEVAWQPLAPVVDACAALAEDAPRVWDDLPGNQCFEWRAGDAQAVAEAFARASHVVSIEVLNNRLVTVPLEPRTALGEYDPTSGRYTLHSGCQSVHQMRLLLSDVLAVAESEVRVRAPDTGGGFGTRSPLYPEHVLVCWAARRLGRPVRWLATRAECFVSDAQARDQSCAGQLALDADGRFLALRVDTLWNHGAYLSPRAVFVHVNSMAPVICGPYAITASEFRIRGVFTNTVGIHAFRGVARAEAAYLLERLVDSAARISGIDRLTLRRRNLVAPSSMPYRSASGASLADADFGANLERVLGLADWDGFASRRAEAATRGRLRGIGVVVTVESAGGVPREFADIEIDTAGEVLVRVGTRNFGMGHETVYAQVLADRLGVSPERVRVIDDDSDAVREGAGSHGSRAMRMGGGAVSLAADALIARATPLAAELLQSAPATLAFDDGLFTVDDSARSVSLATVAAYAAERGESLRAEAVFQTTGPVYPNGAQVSEVEIDPDTGEVRVVAHSVVHDVGVAINPAIVEGQIHGAAVHGIAQALHDHVLYDPRSGQLLSGTLMDYRLPRADDLPSMRVLIVENATADNPLGAKGVGEGPTVGATPAVVNAVLDALAERGITHLDMPLTPSRVWQALQDAVRGRDERAGRPAGRREG